MIYKILYLLVHFIISLKIYVNLLCTTIFARCRNALDIGKFSQLVENGKCVKLPKHLGLVFTENELSLCDISKILYWCFALGIPQVSIYDYKGEIKRRKEEIEEKTRGRLKTSPSYHETSSIAVSESYYFKNSDLAIAKLQVALVSYEDGRTNLAEHTKRLAQMTVQGKIKTADIDPNFVDSYLQERGCMQDPDLLIHFGPGESLMGYLPWQIRLTEILSITSHKHIDYSRFYSTISSFGDIKQRFGK